MDQTQSRSPVASKPAPYPAHLVRHQKSVSDSAAFKLSMLNLSACASSPASPVGAQPNPKRLSTHSDSSLQTDLSSSSALETDSTNSYAPEPTPTRHDARFGTQSPLLRARQPIRTFSNPIPVPVVDQTYHQLATSVPVFAPWPLVSQIDPRPAGPKCSIDEPSVYADPALSAWHAHQLGLQHQLLQQYTRLQAQSAGLRAAHSRTASYQSSVSTSTDSSARLPSVLDAYTNAGIGLNPYLGLGVGLPSAAEQIEAAEKDLAREAAAYNARKADFRALLDAQSLQQAAITMAYTGQSHPLLSGYGDQSGLASAITRLVNLRAGEANANGGPSSTNKKTNLYKTELCRSWEEKGSCRYGSKCQFAHGQDELKPVSRHPKFKTEICRTFWLHGSCPYGKRCCFLHTTANDSGSSPAEPSSNEPATSRLQQRTSASVEPRSRLDRLRPVSASGVTLLRSAPALSRASASPKHTSELRFSPALDRPTSALSDRSSAALLTPFSVTASSPTDCGSGLSATAAPFEVK